MDNEIKPLKKQIMISQFSHIAGCSAEQPLQILQSARWNYEARVCEDYDVDQLPLDFICAGISLLFQDETPIASYIKLKWCLSVYPHFGHGII